MIENNDPSSLQSGVRRLPLLLASLLVLLFATSQAVATGSGPTDIIQPNQPESGPGGKSHKHKEWRVSAGGEGNDAWYVFEPTKPRPKMAPVSIIMHGYGEYEGYDTMFELINHTVLRGSIVIYPRWQTDLTVPCPGPFDIEPCVNSAQTAIHGALAYLRADPSRVQPRTDRASYFGFSFGGIITANLANRYRSLHLPKPRAMFIEDPHDGGLTGVGEPALDDSLAGIPKDVKIECHSGAEGTIGEPGYADSGCNALFPMLGQVPKKNKNLVLTYPDTHGSPPLSSHHGVCASSPGTADAYDWNFCWKVWDALRSCAFGKIHCEYALGNTPEHRSNGKWSDGVPIKPLKIRAGAPIRP